MEKSLHYPAGRDGQRAFEKKPRRGADMVALYTVWYNFVRQHKNVALFVRYGRRPECNAVEHGRRGEAD